MDSAGRLFVADRANNRTQIFNQDGTFLAEWRHFGRPSGICIRDDIIYVGDSHSERSRVVSLAMTGLLRRAGPAGMNTRWPVSS